MSFKIDLKIFLFILIFYFIRQIDIYAYMMFFALVHELGHLFTGITLGFKPESIKITPLGFCINFKIPIDEYNKKINKSTLIDLKKIVIDIGKKMK